MNAIKKLDTSEPSVDRDGPTPEGGYFIGAESVRDLGDGDPKIGRKRLRMFMADERDPKVHLGPTSKPAAVRFATQDDELAVLTLLIKTCSMETISWAPISADRILYHVQLGTRQQGGVVGVIDGPDGKPIGATVMIAAQPAHSLTYYIHEVFNAVHPDHRTGTHASDLLEFGKWLSDEWTAKFGYRVCLLSAVHSRSRIREKIRFFRRHMTQVGAAFLYPTPTGA